MRKKTGTFKRRLLKAGSLLGLALLLNFTAPGLLPASELREYDVKAGFIYQFTRFIEWPENGEGEEPFVFCVVGKNPFGGVLESFEKEDVRGRPMVVRHVEKWKNADSCHVMFISGSEKDDVAKIIRENTGKPVLTVSETSDFIEQGGIINFVRKDNKIRFEINQEKAEQANLKISSKLLKLAARVIMVRMTP